MEPLEIEDLIYLVDAVDSAVIDSFDEKRIESLMKSRGIIKQMIKDKEFELDQTTLPKI